ncbi:hypothetical protein [Citrobacter sp. wls715]|uniref:hypothetical protein n=1 Tax=Citrobacter sp. wls715 TaxID=2576421 RepID=UPI0020176556|nr:hypothetical protein [Citrobacter sp. wls715]
MSTIDVLNTGSQWSTAPEVQNSIPKQLCRNKTVGNFRDNIKSVSNSSDKKLSRAATFHTIQRISDCRPNSETTATVNVPLKAQVSVMGTLTLVSGSGDDEKTLNLHVPAKHVGNPLVKYLLVEKDGGTTFARTLDRKERMTLIADSAIDDSTGKESINIDGVKHGDNIIPWDNIIAWQEPEAEYSTFDKPNDVVKLKLFIREKDQDQGIILNENNALPPGVLCGKESLETHFPTLLDTSKLFQENKVSVEYVNSLVHEFGSGVPARVIDIGIDADIKESFGKDKLYHLQKNIYLMFRNSNGKNWEALQQSKRSAGSTRSIAKKHYAKGIDALCADWPAKSMEGWTDKDKLRCAVIENLVKEGHLKFISKADAEKYLPTIYHGKKFNQYINTVYAADSGYRTALSRMVNDNNFSGIQDVKTVSSRADNIRGAISSLEKLGDLTPKQIKRELKQKEKEQSDYQVNHIIPDRDAKSAEYGQEIGELKRQLALLKNKAYRKEITSLKMELKKIIEAEPGSKAEPGSVERMVADCLQEKHVENAFSQKGIDALRELRDSKISGLHNLEDKHKREISRHEIAWLDNHIETLTVKEAAKASSVVKSYYNQLSLKDKVLFLQQESTHAWDKYASYSGKEHTSGNRELARKYHHLAITRESQLKYLLSSIEKMVDIKGADFTFSSHALEEIRSLNDEKLKSVNGTDHQNKEQCRATEKQAKRINEFLKWASDLPQNAKTNATVGQPSQPEASEHIVDTQATEAAVSQSSEPDPFIDMLSSEEELVNEAAVNQSSEQEQFIDMSPSEEELATEAAVNQSSEQEQFIDMSSSEEKLVNEAAVSQDKPIVGGNETLASNVSTDSTVPVGGSSPAFTIKSNNNKYKLKDINALEEKARKTSDRAEKKRLLEEIKEQKSILRKMNVSFENIEFTENGMVVTELQMQKHLLVQIKYFYDSNGKYDEDSTEYKPISGKGNLKIPGVEGTIDTILGCSYKRSPILLGLPEIFPDGYSKEDIIAVKKLVPKDKKYEIIRTMNKSEKKHFLTAVKNKEADHAAFIKRVVGDFNNCFQQSGVRLSIDTKNAIAELEEKYGKQYIQRIIKLASSWEKKVQEKSTEIKKLEPFELSKPEYYKREYLKKNEEMAKIKKERDVLFDKILLEKGLKLTAGKYDTFVMLMRPGSMPHSLLHLMNDTTVGLNYIRSRYGKDNKVDFFSLTFDTPLEIPIDSIFLRADNPGEEITDVKGVVKKSSRANETEMLLPSEYLIKKFENVRNGNDTMRYMTDGNGSITIGSDNKESMDFVFEQIELSKFRTKLLTSGRKAFPSGYPVFNDCHPYTIKPLDNGGYYCFDDEKYDLLLAAEAAKSASSSVNENVAQALPLQTQTPSQSLQENNVIGKTMSSREIRRLQESSRLPVSNSNETSIQKNEQLVENSQNTGNIKRQEPSTEDKGTLKAFIRNTVQNSSMDVKAEFEISALTEFVKFVYKKEINIIEVPESYSEKEREKMFHDIKVSNKDHKKISILDYGNGSFQLVAKNSEKESIFEAVSRALPKEKNSPPLKHQSYARLATKRAGDLASYSTRDHIPLDDLLNENYDLNTVLNMRTPTLTNGGKNDTKIKEIKEMKAIFSTIKSGDVMSVIKPLGDTYLPGGLSEWPSEPKWPQTVKISNPEERAANCANCQNF